MYIEVIFELVKYILWKGNVKSEVSNEPLNNQG